MKKPSDRSVRSALTTLKKAEILKFDNRAINLDMDTVTTVAIIPVKYLSPKKTSKRPLKTKKVRVVKVDNSMIGGDNPLNVQF